MVNSKNLLTAGVMSLAIASIVTYMQVNGLTTEDITLVDACYKASQAKGINVETCDQLKQHDMEWDTVVPCIKFFQEDVYFYTPRMMFNYFAGGKSEISNLGRKNKGEESTVYTSAQNLTFAEALQDRCAAASQDPSYPVWRDISAQIVAGVAPEDIDTSKYEDRELYGWNDAVSWVVSEGNTASDKWESNLKRTIQILTPTFNRWTQTLANNANYKACSLGLALKKVYPAITDYAECSGRHPTRCKHTGHSYGTSNWWNTHDRSSSYRLNNGCNGHDVCLENEAAGRGDKDVFWQCDEDLSNAGYRGVQWHWPGIRCGWRGCRTWWFGWKYTSRDSRVIASTVWLSMDTHPNGP